MISYKNQETVWQFGYKSADEKKLVFLVERWNWTLSQFDEQTKIAMLEELVSKGADINLLNIYGNKLHTIAKSDVLKAYLQNHPQYTQDYSIFRAKNPKSAVIVLKGNDGTWLSASHDDNIPMLIANELNMDVLSFDTRLSVIPETMMEKAIQEFNSANLPITLLIKAHGILENSGEHTLWFNNKSNNTIKVLEFFTKALNHKPYDVIMTSCQAGSMIKGISKDVLPVDSNLLVLSEFTPDNEDASLVPSYMLTEIIKRLAENQINDSLINAIKQDLFLFAKYYSNPNYLTVKEDMHIVYPKTWVKHLVKVLPNLKPESKLALLKYIEKFLEPSFVLAEGCDDYYKYLSDKFLKDHSEETQVEKKQTETDLDLNGVIEKDLAFWAVNFSPKCNSTYKSKYYDSGIKPIIEKLFENKELSGYENKTSGVFSLIYEYLHSAEFIAAEPKIAESFKSLVDPSNNLDRKLWLQAKNDVPMQQHLMKTVHPKLILDEALRGKVKIDYSDKQAAKLLSYAYNTSQSPDLKSLIHDKLALLCFKTTQCIEWIDEMLDKVLAPENQSIMIGFMHNYQSTNHFHIEEGSEAILSSEAYSGLKVLAVIEMVEEFAMQHSYITHSEL